MTLSLSLLAIMLWVVGYQYGRNPTPNDELASSGLDKVILAPKWLFYLCGAPRPANLPHMSLTIFSIRAQIAGLLFGIVTLVFHYWASTINVLIIGCGLALLATHIFTYYFSNLYQAK